MELVYSIGMSQACCPKSRSCLFHSYVFPLIVVPRWGRAHTIGICSQDCRPTEMPFLFHVLSEFSPQICSIYLIGMYSQDCRPTGMTCLFRRYVSSRLLSHWQTVFFASACSLNIVVLFVGCVHSIGVCIQDCCPIDKPCAFHRHVLSRLSSHTYDVSIPLACALRIGVPQVSHISFIPHIFSRSLSHWQAVSVPSVCTLKFFTSRQSVSILSACDLRIVFLQVGRAYSISNSYQDSHPTDETCLLHLHVFNIVEFNTSFPYHETINLGLYKIRLAVCVQLCDLRDFKLVSFFLCTSK